MLFIEYKKNYNTIDKQSQEYTSLQVESIDKKLTNV